jgi:predicted nucleic acid-binding protein
MEPVRPMIVHLDSSVLVDALTGPRRSFAALERTVAQGHIVGVSALVLYEWRRGPRTPDELEDQEALVPSADGRPFGTPEALRAAQWYRRLKRARGRDMDLAIAACALEHGARLWTLNRADFQDLAGLELYDPTSN